MTAMKRYYLYMIECSNGYYYTGYTTDIERRYQEHQKGTEKCKYTRSFPPVQLAACWQILCTQPDILRLERKVKKYSRIEKKQLVENPKQLVLDGCVTWL